MFIEKSYNIVLYLLLTYYETYFKLLLWIIINRHISFIQTRLNLDPQIDYAQCPAGSI